MANEYEWLSIHGVRYTKTCFKSKSDTQDTTKDSQRRKPLKNNIGKKNMDTVMLDSKTLPDGSSEYCNAIVVIANQQKWIEYFSELYQNKPQRDHIPLRPY